MENRERAESAAAAWIARRERDDWSEADQTELTAWIAATTDNRVAWLRTDAAWQQTTRLKSLSTSSVPGNVPTPGQVQLPFFNAGDIAIPSPPVARERQRAFIRARAVAASILLACAVATAWYLMPSGPSYETAIGALQAVPLSDGSRVTLNTNTQIKVDLTQTERRVSLAQGEAYFEVARDPSRPFVVHAGDKRVIALGTQFSVRREGDQVRVFVTEGKVRIEQGAAGASRPIMQLQAGNIARADADGVLVQEKPIAEVEQLLSWRTGYLAFDRTPLADAVAEFNRYSRRKIVIEDPSVAAIRVGGNFRATNVDAFVRLIESDFPIAAIQKGDQIILTGTPPP
jgi:transmembrane sensor